MNRIFPMSEKKEYFQKPLVSLIIAFYNNIQLLQFIFESLKRQTFQDFEVVIADDGSNMKAVEFIKQEQKNQSFPIKHCWHEDNGWQKNKALNNAIVSSEGAYLVFTDGDCILHQSFLEDHYLNRKKGIVLSGRRVQLSLKQTKDLTLHQIQIGYFEKGFGLLKILIDGITGRVGHVENAIRIKSSLLRFFLIKEKEKGILGCNFSIHKTDILYVNGFDERYLHPGTGEDTDLNHRLKRAGICSIPKKHLLTMYHIYHKKADVNHPSNLELLMENDRRNCAITPFGIKKI
jgi:glycosyltransferase involved in cell wall biosynthesis